MFEAAAVVLDPKWIPGKTFPSAQALATSSTFRIVNDYSMAVCQGFTVRGVTADGMHACDASSTVLECAMRA